jgi:hypothetical protein
MVGLLKPYCQPAPSFCLPVDYLDNRTPLQVHTIDANEADLSRLIDKLCMNHTSSVAVRSRVPDFSGSNLSKRQSMSQGSFRAADDRLSQATHESLVAGSIAASSATGRNARNVLLAGLVVAVLGLASVLVALRVFVAQRIPELSEAALAEAEERWEGAAVASYDMDIEISGARPGRIHIEVRNNEVTTMTRNGRSPPPRTWAVWSVPGMLETLERELELAQDPVHEMQAAAGTQLRLRCEFDPRFGYPRQYHRIVTPGGPEVFWAVTRFEEK